MFNWRQYQCSKGEWSADQQGENIPICIFGFLCHHFATCQVFEVNTADAAKGNLKELEAIAAAVIGGIVMTGGFGTVMGIIVGAFIFGIAKGGVFLYSGN